MKVFYISLLFAAVSAGLYAQPPQKLSYQAVIRDANGILVSNKEVGIRIQILSTSETGTAVYTEEHSPTTNVNGLVNLEIGNGTPVSGIFTTIDWANGTYFIKTEADTDGGTNYSVSGVSQILSVPYALNAKTAETLKPHYIGEKYGGGTVFHVYDSGLHGLIAATADINTVIRWHEGGVQGIYTQTLAGADGLMAGKSNTAIIIAVQGVGDGQPYAARICHEYMIPSGLVFGDWYLPSKLELNIMYLRQGVIGNFAEGQYWSSTEANTAQAWSQDFYSGLQSESTKNNTFRVRAIRAF